MRNKNNRYTFTVSRMSLQTPPDKEATKALAKADGVEKMASAGGTAQETTTAMGKGSVGGVDKELQDTNTGERRLVGVKEQDKDLMWKISVSSLYRTEHCTE